MRDARALEAPCRLVRKRGDVVGTTGESAAVASHGSGPAIACSTSAASSTVVAKGPIWSSDEAKAIRP